MNDLEEFLMREVMIEMTFSSAHALRGYRGKCENTHGHNYRVEVYVRGQELNEIGLLIDFKDLKEATRRVVNYLDHKNINELPPFDVELNPSAEHLAGYFLHEVGRQINNDRIEVYKVRVWETDTCSATYQID
jgi:6-pyruvoyltetrahydropterin/6-carboxytetrahydropterin synthase